jgi:hypothetical protein
VGRAHREAFLQQWARTRLQAEGIEVYTQPVHARGANTHAVVRGARADGMEGLVLVTPLSPSAPDGAVHAAALGLHLMRCGPCCPACALVYTLRGRHPFAQLT